MNAGASTSAVPSPIEGSGTAWVLLGAWELSPARPTPIHPRHECRGFSALLVRTWQAISAKTAMIHEEPYEIFFPHLTVHQLCTWLDAVRGLAGGRTGCRSTTGRRATS